jgi:quercetin dioxygenase-like cupin family protein
MTNTAAHAVRFGKGLGTQRVLGSAETGGAIGVVLHDLPPKQLGSPLHTHANEDEYSYVLSGTLSAQIGDELVEAGPGEAVVKPRGIPHAFWNAGDEELRFLEIISPGGFEDYFFDLAGPLGSGDLEGIGRVLARYQLDLRMETIPELVERGGLDSPL